MTYEEAIIDIRENIQPIIGGKSLDIAISAIEKQIPKKPIKNGIDGYICPHCGGVIVDLSHELYHRDCGGRLE